MTGPTDNSRHSLSPDDARVLDLLAEGGFDPQVLASLPAADRARGDVIVRMLSLLGDYPVADGDDTLVDATLARIERHDAQQQASFRLVGEEEAARPRLRLGFRLADLVTLAAVILVGVSVVSPVMSNVRFRSQQTACGANLASLGGALAAYSNDNGGLLPVSRTPLSWEEGRNSENLDLLVDGGYCEAGHLNCPGHSGAGCGYGYRVIVGPIGARLDVQPTLAVLADRNPAVDHALAGLPVSGFRRASANHAGRGQNILFGDLTLVWTVSPVVSGPGKRQDNLWLLTVEGSGPSTEDLRRGLLPADNEQFVSQ